MVKVIQFEDDSEQHIHQKIVSNFPILRDLGWICVKPDSKNMLHPYKIDSIKDGKLIKSYVTNFHLLLIFALYKYILLILFIPYLI